MSQLANVLEQIDAANSADPRSIEADGKTWPYELLYGRRMSDVLAGFEPDASELLQIAARGQHIERWVIPRDSYPRNKPGYHRWRGAQKKRHGSRVAEMMSEHGYSTDDCEHVSSILQKKHLKTDTDTQCIEDVACLVFLTYYADVFAADHEDEKVINILLKTLPKMSEKGHGFAGRIDLSERMATCLGEAIRRFTETAE
ncbi:DUF4202 domain-containing protein [Coralliovum pocilloporae]|uniref:DUF4202 domain-containing protein n=1 Tax=Coralliovum pocilloporae TaxID=3066369 RepID=UPI00330789F1